MLTRSRRPPWPAVRRARAPRTQVRSKIGATLWAKADHELGVSTRHPEELQELARSRGPKAHVGTPREARCRGLAFDVGTKVYTQLLTAAQLRSELRLAPARE